MNILIISGSPKGKNSITFQTGLYLEKRFPKYKFDFLHGAQQIAAIEKDYEKAQRKVKNADLVLFCYPVYTFLVPSQMQRFIESLKKHNLSLEGKYVAQLTTSKHFYDMTAHKYVEENTYDMGGKYLDALSADMEALLSEKGREEADCFFEKIMFQIENGIYKEKKDKKKTENPSYELKYPKVEVTGNKDILVLTNADVEDVSLRNMIKEFSNTSKNPVRSINLREFKFASGCIGCLDCTTSGECIFKDGFDDLLKNQIQTADAIVYAFRIENHYTHHSFKLYDDRQFSNGHRSMIKGMPVGYILCGNYEEEENLKTVIEGRSQAGGVFLCGVATDQVEASMDISKLALYLDYALDNKISLPSNFYGVGGTKIFRDLVYLMQGIMKEDHKFYKENGIYDFPHNKRLKMAKMKIIGAIMNSRLVKNKMRGKTAEYILAPYSKLIEEVKPKE